MSKRDYVYKVLDKVKGYREKGETIRAYLDTHDDPAYIDYLYEQFTVAVEETLKQEQAEKMQSLGNFLNDLHSKESASQQADEEDLKKLDQLLMSI